MIPGGGRRWGEVVVDRESLRIVQVDPIVEVVEALRAAIADAQPTRKEGQS